ncbi:hypothetical protein ACP70R_003839 [Stipagrostis hirtigluma subsp. patula]
MPQELANVSRRRKARRRSEVGIDILPDEALQRVLSFLPLAMPALRITSEQGFLTPEDVTNLNRFLNMFMFLRDRGAPLDLCEIEIEEFDECDNQPHVGIWIQQALLSQAGILSVNVAHQNDGFVLDDVALISKHLTRLQLSSVGLKGKFLDFSCCLVLKSLCISSCDIYAEKISSQSLKQLTIWNCLFYGIVRTRISTPSLAWLELSDCGDTPLLESMPLLEKAFVRFQSDSKDCCGKEEFGGSCTNKFCRNCGDNCDRSGDCILLKGLSRAESLELVAQPGVFIFKRDLTWCPTFSNLKTLLLNEWCVAIDFDPLICFLQHTPVLEKLTLQLCKAPENWVEPRGFYIPTIEPLASRKLKVVEVKCEEFDERVHQISRLLSIFNTYIEEINIKWSAKRSVW